MACDDFPVGALIDTFPIALVKTGSRGYRRQTIINPAILMPKWCYPLRDLSLHTRDLLLCLNPWPEHSRGTACRQGPENSGEGSRTCCTTFRPMAGAMVWTHLPPLTSGRNVCRAATEGESRSEWVAAATQYQACATRAAQPPTVVLIIVVVVSLMICFLCYNCLRHQHIKGNSIILFFSFFLPFWMRKKRKVPPINPLICPSSPSCPDPCPPANCKPRKSTF